MTDNAKKHIKQAIVILFAAVLGILLGRLVSNYEMRFMLDREYRGEYKGVEIYTCGEINVDNYNAHIKMLSYAPDELLAYCEKMYFTGGGISVPANDSGFDQALGLTQDKVIYVSTQSFGADVVMHELFHTYDNGKGMISSNDEDFYRIFDEEKDNIRIIAGSDSLLASEFFAEAGAIYIISPFELSIRAPKAYRYFNSLFALYEE